MVSETYLSTDEQHDVLLSLREALHQLERVAAGEVYCWKWAVIALASALNGALVCNLSGAMQVGALNDKDAMKTINALQEGALTDVPAKPHLAPPHMLLQRARREDERLEKAGPILKITSSQKCAFDNLITYRNAFLHFEPRGWSIETGRMHSIFEKALQIVMQLADDGWSLRHLCDEDRADLQEIIGRVLQVLQRLH